ncbi:MAG: MaoC family dehydratase [Gammaproteobacteria bacterium]|nr:MaoC family dehydratase [Gammaproteobacteria bacterium]
MTDTPIAAALAVLQAKVGQQVHLSDWMTVTQDRINAFADATLDRQWIHVDVERAHRESPFGAPIAHGFLTLSLMVPLRGLVEADTPIAPGVRNVVNYGLNKLRFANPVRVLQITEQYTAEIDGETKPACIAESLMRLVF